MNQSRLAKCFTRDYENVAGPSEETLNANKSKRLSTRRDSGIIPAELAYPDTANHWPDQIESESEIIPEMDIVMDSIPEISVTPCETTEMTLSEVPITISPETEVLSRLLLSTSN